MAVRGWGKRAAFALVAIFIGFYYSWASRVAGYEFHWGGDLTGYYDYLARGFAAGHLYVPIDPDPRLLALPNPLDPNAGLDLPKFFDGVLFNKKYYVYHGAGPAVMLFLPWRLATGYDLPENFALFLFCFAGYLFSAGALTEILALAEIDAGPALLAVMLLAIGACQSVPFLLNRVLVYEIAIGGGYFCISAALYFLLRGVRSGRIYWLVASGVMFGISIACRPHLALADGIALAVLGRTSKRGLIACAIPFAAAGLAVAAYNYARFGNPLEFGLTYQITGPNPGRVHPDPANIVAGLYYMVFCRPEFTPVFPWIRMIYPPRMFPAPKNYFVELEIGALFLAPFLPCAFFAFLARRARVLIWSIALCGFALLLFITLTGLSTQRYEVDFLPLTILAAVIGFLVVRERAGRVWRTILSAAMTAAVGWGMAVNAALCIAGPYDDIVQYKPARFVKIADWFSPEEKHRPLSNPPLDLHFSSEAHPIRELVTAGPPLRRYELFMENVGGKLNLISRYGGSAAMCPVAEGADRIDFRLQLSRDGVVTVTGNGRLLLEHKVGTLVTALSEVAVYKSTGNPKQ